MGYVQDKVRPGTGREGALGYERYVANENMAEIVPYDPLHFLHPWRLDVRRDCFVVGHSQKSIAAGRGSYKYSQLTLLEIQGANQLVEAFIITEEIPACIQVHLPTFQPGRD